MSQMVLVSAAGALVLSLIFLGDHRADLLTRLLVRPAILVLLAMVVLLTAAPSRRHLWPYALVMTASSLGVWESYAAAFATLRSDQARRSAVAQVQICATWLGNVLANLAVLNLAASIAFPGTFQWRGELARPLDVTYLTFLTFASGGYGDVLPGNTLGKLLVMATSLAGLVYATILFAALFQRSADHER
jgi:hypothetical protein